MAHLTEAFEHTQKRMRQIIAIGKTKASLMHFISTNNTLCNIA